MAPTARLSAEQRDNLVAYLDGELSDAETRQIDQILAQSEVARHEVEALARSWEMLDVLPKQKASPDFSRNTITIARQGEERVPLTEQPWFRWVRLSGVCLIWACALGGAVWGGFLLTRQAVPNRAERLLNDYPVIQRYEQYEQIGSLEFLKQLDRAGVFNAAPEGARE